MREEKMPSLTEKIRIFALGGLDEDGKNLFCVDCLLYTSPSPRD